MSLRQRASSGRADARVADSGDDGVIHYNALDWARDAAPGEPEALGDAEKSECNPFEYDSPVTSWELFKMVFFTVTLIAPLRLVLFIVLVVLAYLCAFFASLGLSHESILERPLSPWRRAVLFPIRIITRIGLFIFGFYTIKVNGSLDPRAAIIAPNHVSMFDLLIMYHVALPSAVSKAETFKVPLLGAVFRALQVIALDRSSSGDRDQVKDTIARFAASRADGADPKGRFPPVLIFPQGTCTQQSVITMFQRGAFTPKMPVQPVALDYKFKHFNPAFLVNRKTDWFLLRHFTQFRMYLEVTFLPLHFPTEAEKADPTLFANSVRGAIAHHLGSKVTDHCFEDAILYRCALNIEEKRFKPKSKFEPTDESHRIKLHGLEVKELKDLFDVHGSDALEQDKRFTLGDAKLVMEKFAEADTNGDGMIDLDEFAHATGYPRDSPQTHRLFSFFDRDHSGKIDFRELAVGMAICNPYSTSRERVKFAFDVYDEDNDGFVSEEELRKLVKFSGEGFSSKHARATERQLDQLLEIVRQSHQAGGDPDGPLLISWKEFEEYVPKDSEIVSTALLSVNERAKGEEDTQAKSTSSTAAESSRNHEKKKFFPSLVRRSSSRIHG